MSMNIQLLTPKFNQNVQNVQNTHYSNPVMPSKLTPLKADTVSFSGSGGAKVYEFLQSQFIEENPRLQRIATTYLDILESVAFKLKDKGFSFDRAYCELSPVKSPESRTSKIVRSGNLKVPDTIRATLYCNDPYDLAKLNDELLPMMKQRGYVLANTQMSVQDLMKRGYIPNDKELKLLERLKTEDFVDDIEKEQIQVKLMKTVPDLDIRLEDVAEQLPKLDSSLRYSIGKPQKSGYEDIQMRFVRDFDKKKDRVQHELIILFGPNYSSAKHEESSRIYNYLRKLDELHVDTKGETSNTSNAGKFQRYIDLVRQMFRGKVSQKLFLNGKNKDYADIPEEIPIRFSGDDTTLYEGYFNGLKLRLANLHKEALKSTNLASVKRQLNKDYKEDKLIIDEVYKGLKDAMEHYNYQADLRQ